MNHIILLTAAASALLLGACISAGPRPLPSSVAPTVSQDNAPPLEDSGPEHAAIMAVSKAFHTAIENRDWKTFRGLFVGPEVRCVGTFETWTEEPALVYDVDGLVSIFKNSRGQISEPATNHKLEIRGDIASLWFEYEFIVNGHRRNWGNEAWLLARVKGQWKITGVVWSIIMPKPPERQKVEVAEAALTPHVGTYTSKLGKISIDVREGRLHLKMPWDTDWVPMEAMSEVSFFRKAYELVLNFNEGGVEVAMGVYKVQAKRAGG